MRCAECRVRTDRSGFLISDFGFWTSDFGVRTLDFGFRLFQAVFLPNLGEALALAVIIAEDAHIIALARPTMELGKELTTLRLGHRGLRWAIGERTKGIKALELRAFSFLKDGALTASRARHSFGNFPGAL